MPDLDKFFSPRSLAFLGASADHGKWGYRVLSNIVSGGFQGKIYPINPKGGAILGIPVFQSVSDVPEVPDLAIIVVPPPSMIDTIRECVNKGVKAGVVITAGFAELGEVGSKLQQEMVELARKGGMSLIGPNCFGILSTPAKLYSQMPRIFPPIGPIGVVSQSGNVGLTISRRAMAIDFGCSRVISTGNEADLHAEDFVQYLASDEQTKVILSYIEGFKDGRRFFEIARQASREKPIVMIKVGETEAGASAAKSHTAALSGSDVIFDAMCRQVGIIRVHNLNELMNVGVGFICNPLPKGRRVGIVTLGGGWGVLAADACAKLGLDVVKLSDEILNELDSFLPAWWSRNNPIDLVAGAMGDEMLRVIEILARWDKTDSIISLGIPVPPIAFAAYPKDEEERKQRVQVVKDAFINAFQRIKEISEKYGKPIITAAEMPLPQGEHSLEQDIIRGVSKLNMHSYTMPDEAAMVLRAMVQYSEYLQRLQVPECMKGL